MQVKLTITFPACVTPESSSIGKNVGRLFLPPGGSSSRCSSHAVCWASSAAVWLSSFYPQWGRV